MHSVCFISAALCPIFPDINYPPHHTVRDDPLLSAHPRRLRVREEVIGGTAARLLFSSRPGETFHVCTNCWAGVMLPLGVGPESAPSSTRGLREMKSGCDDAVGWGFGGFKQKITGAQLLFLSLPGVCCRLSSIPASFLCGLGITAESSPR